MNLPNKITVLRLFLTGVIIGILIFPFDAAGVSLPKLFINESIVVDIRYIVSGFLFIIASLTDFLDGFLARKNNAVTDFGKMIDAIADKVLVNSVLVILSSTGFIHPIITVVIIIRDIAVDAIKMVAGNKKGAVAAIKIGKVKTACLMVGIVLTLFYNLPFELWNFRVSDLILIIGTILAVVSGIEYYNLNKDVILASGK